ncbi:LacI family DNA-binding transcriptional regulator [Paenibacillus alkaliterrae]|uniref:LacI family DNA-binding transcriptional regulator n=1 Tax=Paenibacillus alkaliterrae TaxID=320909 RepID=UPI001F2F42D6|nr:LacI family DNA-binding transcriptional regulator [Paenibacillus alkaliterrae]MCF2940907.1 LacI family DNA-binding transcriptional regulator [Paenibacillus alkaliterrae]
MSKKVTMQQIAGYLGVSKFVVSKALSGKGGVSETTKERVIQAASQLGYFSQKNAYVKTMKLEQLPKVPAAGKQSVLVLMPNIRFRTKESAYCGRILDGIASRLEADGFGMVIVSEQSVDHFLHFLNPNGILGLIGVGEISTALLLEVHRIGLPMVLVDHEDMLIPSDTVFTNNYESMYRLTKHLIGSGHKQLCFIGDIAYSRSFKDRFLGFRSALEEEESVGDARDWSLSVKGFEHEHFEEPIRQWAAKKQKLKTLPTALLCANDMIAIGAVHALEGLGIAVPGDVSVTGFDNIEHAYKMTPALTTVHVPKELLGRRAVERLLGRIAGQSNPMEKLLLAGELLYRESTGPANG